MPGPHDREPGGRRDGSPGAAADRRAAAAGEPGRGEVFQYAVLQVVPSEERGEALNVGVVLHARRHRFLAVRHLVDGDRLAALDPRLEPDVVAAHLDAVAAVADGRGTGAIAALERSDRFGWIASPANTLVRPGPVHTGLCDDPRAALDRLFARLVLPPSIDG
ncbi:MAG: DUF3037 domain-containing protein [Solirubrobacteraceae bacterium]|nr:DUF3037 domain-containing protein [Solirubrobacteraceae bacterium]